MCAYHGVYMTQGSPGPLGGLSASTVGSGCSIREHGRHTADACYEPGYAGLHSLYIACWYEYVQKVGCANVRQGH